MTELLWLVPWNGEMFRTFIDSSSYSKVCDMNWFINNKGYVAGKVDGEYALLHRYILGLKIGDGQCVDHINQNRLDNRLSNLRICSFKDNLKNKSKYKNSKSKFAGVDIRALVDGSISYRARIRNDGKCINLGTFKTEIEAAKAFDKKAVELRGRFTHLNFKEDREQWERLKQ